LGLRLTDFVDAKAVAGSENSPAPSRLNWVDRGSLGFRLGVIGPLAGAAAGFSLPLVVGVVLVISSILEVGRLYAGYVIEVAIAVVIGLVIGLLGGAICSSLAACVVAIARRASKSRWLWASFGAVAAAGGATITSIWLIGGMSPSLNSFWFAVVLAPLAAALYFVLISRSSQMSAAQVSAKPSAQS
jgi:hypothetical protein